MLLCFEKKFSKKNLKKFQNFIEKVESFKKFLISKIYQI